MKYKIRYTKGKVEITIESNDKSYIEQKLLELGAKALKGVKAVKAKSKTKTKPKTKTKTKKRKMKATNAMPDLNKIATAIRGANNASDIRQNVLDRSDRISRILLCYYFAAATGQPGLTTREVEALTGKLGHKIAQPNVGKVIRLNANKYLSAHERGAATSYTINQKGRAALETVLGGGQLS